MNLTQPLHRLQTPSNRISGVRTRSPFGSLACLKGTYFVPCAFARRQTKEEHLEDNCTAPKEILLEDGQVAATEMGTWSALRS
jgi:hypothetical protein